APAPASPGRMAARSSSNRPRSEPMTPLIEEEVIPWLASRDIRHWPDPEADNVLHTLTPVEFHDPAPAIGPGRLFDFIFVHHNVSDLTILARVLTIPDGAFGRFSGMAERSGH